MGVAYFPIAAGAAESNARDETNTSALAFETEPGGKNEHLYIPLKRPDGTNTNMRWFGICPTEEKAVGVPVDIALTSDSNKVTFWKTSSDAAATADQITSISFATGETVSKIVYIRGETVGNTVLHFRDAAGGAQLAADLDVTTSKVELTKTPASWMPKGGSEENTVTFTATISPPGVQGKIRFSLADVSNAQGYCVNKGTSTLPDLKFPTGQAGFGPITPSGQEATTATEVNSATITVLSLDYGAYGNIRAETVTIGGHPFSCVARVEEGGQIQEYATIPRDEDDNFIADCWTHNSGNWEDDDDTSLNNTHNGDGLVRYDEYRGVDIDNDGKVATDERLNPTRKDLFVQGQGFGGGFVFAWGNAFSEAQIEVHEFQGTALRGIDLLSVSLLDAGGHIHHEQEPPEVPRFWLFDTTGQSPPSDDFEHQYGVAQINRKAIDYYLNDKPYMDGSTWTAAGTWGGPPNGVLDPLSKVEDANDNGELDTGGDTYDETDGATKSPEDDGDADLDGDHWVVGAFDRDFNPNDIDADGEVELEGAEYEKGDVVRNTVTHEMGHAVGIIHAGPTAPHCDDETCVMYNCTNSWTTDNHFCNACRALIRIHNGGE